MGIVMPHCRNRNHIDLEWDNAVHYTTGELERLHKPFNHPQADVLAAVLKRAADPNAFPGTPWKT